MVLAAYMFFLFFNCLGNEEEEEMMCGCISFVFHGDAPLKRTCILVSSFDRNAHVMHCDFQSPS